MYVGSNLYLYIERLGRYPSRCASARSVSVSCQVGSQSHHTDHTPLSHFLLPAYPEDEAATREKLAFRVANAHEYFYVVLNTYALSGRSPTSV